MFVCSYKLLYMKNCLGCYSRASTQLSAEHLVCHLHSLVQWKTMATLSFCVRVFARLVCSKATAGYAAICHIVEAAIFSDAVGLLPHFTLFFIYPEVSPASSYAKKWRNTGEYTRFLALNCLPTSKCCSNIMCSCVLILEWNIFAISATNHTHMHYAEESATRNGCCSLLLCNKPKHTIKMR